MSMYEADLTTCQLANSARAVELTKGEGRGEDDASDDEGDSWVKVQGPSTLAAEDQRTPLDWDGRLTTR
jgi:hypothetical protein